MRIVSYAVASLSILTLAACAASTPTKTDSSRQELTVSWALKKESTDATGRKTADVSLVVVKEDGSARGIDLGRFAGCGETAAPDDGPLLTLKCWWAGGGDEFQVRMDATNTLVVDHRVLDEETTIPAFTPVRSILLPDDAIILPKADFVR